MTQMFDIFLQSDATLLEINPLGINLQGDLILCDQKLTIDDNAQFRQHALFHMEDFR